MLLRTCFARWCGACRIKRSLLPSFHRSLAPLSLSLSLARACSLSLPLFLFRSLFSLSRARSLARARARALCLQGLKTFQKNLANLRPIIDRFVTNYSVDLYSCVLNESRNEVCVIVRVIVCVIVCVCVILCVCVIVCVCVCVCVCRLILCHTIDGF